MKNKARNDVFLNKSFRSPVNTKPTIITPTKSIPPRNQPGKIIPPGIAVNL